MDGPNYFLGLHGTLCLLPGMNGMAVSLKSPIVIQGGSFHQVHFGSWDAAYWPVPVVSYAHVEVSRVEVLKVLVERNKVLHRSKDRERWRETI